MNERFLSAKEQYAQLGVDVDAAFAVLSEKEISIHCWQGDDIRGFEGGKKSLDGGIQATGNYPGGARNFAELTADFDKALSLIPGKKRISLHANYAVFQGEEVDRDVLRPEHFSAWVEYAKSRGIGIDFNPTMFSHSLSADGLTLSHPDEKIRQFWVRHCAACREIAAYFARELGGESVCNIWIPDGYKDIPADRLSPRLRLMDSLDRILEKKLPGVVDCVESKVFGIGVESYTVGSNEFYLGYAGSREDVYVLLDNGHYHPTETVSDKIPALLPFFDKIPLHITRAVRWDSDHVVLFEDEVREIAKEIVRNGAMDKVLIGLDFFDASINRVAAWVVGTRSVQKALLYALLTPHAYMRKLQHEGRFTELMMLSEELKTLPLGDIWAAYCDRQGVAAGREWFAQVEAYERDVLSARK